ncbi:MAG: COG3650 family protein [Thermomonas sp.]
MKFAIASISLLLVACSAPQSPGDTQGPAPVVSPAASADLPMPISENGSMDTGTPQTLRVVGTEPFWGVQVDGDALTFTTPENQAGLQLRGERTEVPGGGLDISGGSGEQAFSLKLRPGDCSDGMSDMEFTMTAEFHIGETAYRGCAQATK